MFHTGQLVLLGQFKYRSTRWARYVARMDDAKRKYVNYIGRTVFRTLLCRGLV
jgi:hypothetical protein